MIMENCYLIINIDRCWGCRSCQVACKVEHGLTDKDSRPMEAIRVEMEGESCAACEAVPLTCMHCDDPACASVCPQKAIYRDGEGLVQVDEEKCIGCGLCSKACPYGAIGLKTVNGKRKASKCDMCRDRRARGFMTSCEQHCTGGAIVSCGEERLQEMLSPFPYKWSVGKTVYVSQKISSLGKF